MDSDESYKGRPMAVATKTTTASVLLFFFTAVHLQVSQSLRNPKTPKGTRGSFGQIEPTTRVRGLGLTS